MEEAGPADAGFGAGPRKRHQVLRGEQRIAAAHQVEPVAGTPEARLEAVFAAEDFERRDGGRDLGGGGGQEGLVRPPRRQHGAAIEVHDDIAGAGAFEPGGGDQRFGRGRQRFRLHGRKGRQRQRRSERERRQRSPSARPLQLGRKRSQ